LRRRLAVLLAVGAASALPVGLPAAAHGDLIAQAACSNARIGGQSKCIGRGQYCARRYQRDYKRYGLSCSKVDRNGRYHLR
jgi:hypothetical protein